MAEQAKSAVITWLLDSDSSIRWQVLRDLTDASAEEVAAERALVATEGVGARLLALQGVDGSWAGAAWNRGWDSTMHVLSLLREMGLDPASDQAHRAVGQVRDHVTWRGWDWDGTWRGLDFAGTPFFVGEVEPCINGQMAASGAYFRQDVQRVIDRLLGEQLADGGWNCEAEKGSKRSSFHTTICVLEALLEYELTNGSSAEVTEARLRGQEYLLERRLIQRLTTELGLNLAGVEHVLRLQDELKRAHLRMERLERELRAEIAEVHRSYKREIVLYRPTQHPATRS